MQPREAGAENRHASGEQSTAKMGARKWSTQNSVLGTTSCVRTTARLTTTLVDSISFHSQDSKSQAGASIWQNMITRLTQTCLVAVGENVCLQKQDGLQMPRSHRLNTLQKISITYGLESKSLTCCRSKVTMCPSFSETALFSIFVLE